ncbi:MAG: LLM class flavin-dependent oxidoreductase [Acidimicrobiaceae bacterium]|nr:LLM class flavin-dependent oxidoreductase [Acidimicrobiaceae bacterium]
MSRSPTLQIGVTLDGAGWHPAAWRAEGARPSELLKGSYWVDLAREAERGMLDFVGFDDTLALASERRGVHDDRVDRVKGRLDAELIAARVGPATTRIGLLPVATTTHTEPFHHSKAIATLDFVSLGRAGVQVRVSSTQLEAAQFGRRQVPDRWGAPPEDPAVAAFVADLFDEAADFVEVMRQLWDSWEDDAEIRDVATGRFVDRDKLHYIDFEGRFFSVRGPSITPRPPQGQPVVAALAHNTVPYRLAARAADAVFITPHDVDGLQQIVDEIRGLEREVGRVGEPVRIFADLVVFLDPEPGAAAARKAHLDELDGATWSSDAEIFAGTPGELASFLVQWSDASDDLTGFRLRPGVLPVDLTAITDGLVPLLQSRGQFRRSYAESTFRERLGLERPANRYAVTSA